MNYEKPWGREPRQKSQNPEDYPFNCVGCFRFNLCGLTHQEWTKYTEVTKIEKSCPLTNKTEEQVKANDAAWEKRAKEKAENECNKRKAIYCSHCQMWFDTSKGWQASSSTRGLPLCPACKAPLFEVEYENFVEVNKDRWAEVSTWEWPDGSFWFKKILPRKDFPDIRH